MLARYLISFVLGGSLVGACCAQTAQPQPVGVSTDILTEVFSTWRSDGLMGGTIKTLPMERVRLDVTVGTGEVRQFEATNTLVARSSKNLLNKVEGNPIGVMRDATGAVRGLCERAAGVIRYSKSEEQMYPSDLLTKIKQIGIKEQLLGGHTCLQDGKPLFHFEMMAPVGRSKTTLTEGTVFDILLMQVSGQQIEMAEEETKAFRSKLSAGSDVAVHLTDVPQANRPKITSSDASTPALANYRLCGLLIDQKPGLAQIQVGSGVFFVKDTALFPPNKVMNAKTGYLAGAISTWCWKP
jgi:hypothetical protein